MATRLISALTFAFICVFPIDDSALAAKKALSPETQPQTVKKPSVGLPMSKSDCEAKGGKVVAHADCRTTGVKCVYEVLDDGVIKENQRCISLAPS